MLCTCSSIARDTSSVRETGTRTQVSNDATHKSAYMRGRRSSKKTNDKTRAMQTRDQKDHTAGRDSKRKRVEADHKPAKDSNTNKRESSQASLVRGSKGQHNPLRYCSNLNKNTLSELLSFQSQANFGFSLQSKVWKHIAANTI